MTITEYRQGPGKETEASFQRWLMGYARTQGWLCSHFRPARRADGSWSTPLQGDPGWPDVVLSRLRETIVAELKRDDETPTPHQWRWLVLYASARGAEIYVWQPKHRTFIEERLRRRPHDARGKLVLPAYTVDANGRVYVS